MIIKLAKWNSKQLGEMFPSKFLIMIICLFPFFAPASLSYTLSLPFSFDMLLYLWRTAVGAIGIALYLQSHHFRMTVSAFSMAAFCCVYALLSLVTSIKLDYTFYFVVSIAGIACLMEIWIKKYDTALIKTLWIYLLVVFVFNVVFLFIKPEGVYRRYLETYQYVGWSYDVYERVNFLSGDNGFMIFGLPLWYTGMLLAKRNLIAKKWFIFSILLVNISVINIFSVTSIIGIMVLDIMSFLLLRKKPFLLNWNKVILIAIFCNFVIVGFSTSSFLLNPVKNLFGKTLTFSIRSGIWEECFRIIAQSPFVGIGNANTWYCVDYGGRTYAAHNIWLAVLVQGGLVLFVCFIFLINSIIKGRERHRTYDDELIACAAMLSIFIMGSVETLIQNFGFWCLLGLVGATKYLKPYK